MEQEAMQLQLTAAAPTAGCAPCAVPSSSVHTRYRRYLMDAPPGTLPVRIRLTVKMN
jgi:hypothetical protein